MATASLWQRPPRLACDVAVVGGGVIGAATAWSLARLAPGLRVTVLEAVRPAHGASGRNAGFLLLGASCDYAAAVDRYGRDAARRIWQVTRESYQAVAEVGERYDVGFRPTGSVLAAGDDAEADRLRRARTLLRQDGVWTHLLEGDAAAEATGGRRFAAALRVPVGGEVDPARLVRALLAESRAEVVGGWRAAAVEPDGGRVRVGSEGGAEAVADQAFLAVNAWLPALVPALAGVVRPVRAQMLSTAPGPAVLASPVYSHEGYFYVRQRADGRVLVGGARHRHAEAEVGYADATTDALQADLSAYLADHFPALAALPVERRWAGTMGFSADGLPHLGDVPGVPGATFAAGFTGHGLGYALRFGLLAARRILGEPDESADLFDAARVMSA